MNQAALVEVLRTYDAALRENGATGLFIFGSRAVGTQRPDSDLELFIDSDPEAKVPKITSSAIFPFVGALSLYRALLRALFVPPTRMTPKSPLDSVFSRGILVTRTVREWPLHAWLSAVSSNAAVGLAKE